MIFQFWVSETWSSAVLRRSRQVAVGLTDYSKIADLPHLPDTRSITR